MYYLDSQRTLTRRDSSLIAPRRPHGREWDQQSTFMGDSTLQLGTLPPPPTRRPTGTTERELVTLMFDSMLEHIVEAWDTIPDKKAENDSLVLVQNLEMKKPKKSDKASLKRKSRSRLSMSMSQDVCQSWWSSPDERAIIKFRNGNVYEGAISMKCMTGTGRFQWANGTVYMGEFNNNEIKGRGEINWKDQSWYEGEFLGNLRHGRGLYVDSRRQRSYVGEWFYGSKHGEGVIYYSKDFKNSYEGEWDRNVRHGVGKREYCAMSGYNGEWDRYDREGKGLMIWPNHDFYRGDWKEGVMWGHGVYIWDTYRNHSMSSGAISMYRGFWMKGQRNGHGYENFGVGLGAHYSGEFKDNKKHGAGKLVTNDGLVLKDQKLFEDDIITSFSEQNKQQPYRKSFLVVPETSKFRMSDVSVELLDHIVDALKHIDNQREIRAYIINDYIRNNRDTFKSNARHITEASVAQGGDLAEIASFEVSSLRKALLYYETELRHIYYQYATVFNTEEINFRPILIRLYLWQLYYDCNMHEKGLTMVEIDKMFHGNPDWLSKSPHNPFEKIYYWQFLHSLITVASRLYCQTHLPDTKPDTIVAKAFRKFMDRDILTSIGTRKGHLANRYAEFIPMKGLYRLYRSIGEPHSVRQFMCAARRPPHCAAQALPPLLDAAEDDLPLGKNAYIYGDEMSYVVDNPEKLKSYVNEDVHELKLFNFGNVSTSSMIHIFAEIFPQISNNDKIMSLDVEITFLEFFEAFISCTEESIRIKEEELRWRERFPLNEAVVPSEYASFHSTHKPAERLTSAGRDVRSNKPK